jgi:hypothetical protein
MLLLLLSKCIKMFIRNLHDSTFVASGYRMIAALDVFEAVVGKRPTRQSYGNQRLQRQLEGAPDDGHNSTRNMLSGVYATKQ